MFLLLFSGSLPVGELFRKIFLPVTRAERGFIILYEGGNPEAVTTYLSTDSICTEEKFLRISRNIAEYVLQTGRAQVINNIA